MKVQQTPYEQIIGIPLTCGGQMTLSVMKMVDEVCLCAIEVSGSKGSLINVKSTVFTGWSYRGMKEKASTHCSDLNETFVISRGGGSVRLSWGDGIDIVRGVSPDDMTQIAKHFTIKINAYRKAAFALANIPKKTVYKNNIYSFKELS